MSTDFRPVEAAPQKPVWPYAIAGAALVGALVFWAARRDAKPAAQQPVALGNLAAKLDPAAVAAAIVKPDQPKTGTAESAVPQTVSRKPQNDTTNPNMINNGHTTTMVPATELEHERARARAAQKNADASRKQIATLRKELAEARGELSRARGQVASLQNPPQPLSTD